MLNCVLLGLKFPEPLDVHFPVVVIPPIVPLTVTVGLLAQTETLAGPALAVGISVMVTLIVSLDKAHIPLAVVVKISLTLPLAVSAELGR